MRGYREGGGSSRRPLHPDGFANETSRSDAPDSMTAGFPDGEGAREAADGGEGVRKLLFPGLG